MRDEDAGWPGGVDATRIDADLVRRLLAEQLPRWAGLAVRPVVDGGNDHRMFRLGDDLVVRLPSHDGYVPQVRKEQTWLPRLAPQLPLPVPEVVGVGTASATFPAPWSVYRWLDGRPPPPDSVRHDETFAADVARFLVALRAADGTGGPAPGGHSAGRGGPLEQWDDEVGDIVLRVSGRERDLARGLWRDALAAGGGGIPVWVHGDTATGNLLVDDEGRLSAVIDLGCAAVGDPACDTVLRWTRLEGAARRVFVRENELDDATWARGRGWALWKGLIMLTNTPPGQAELGRHVLDELFAGE